jgi:ParB-like nuclease domain
MELEITRLLGESPANPRRHVDQDRVRRYAEVLDHLPPVTVFALEDQTLLLVDGYHRLAAAQQAGRTAPYNGLLITLPLTGWSGRCARLAADPEVRVAALAGNRWRRCQGSGPHASQAR